MKLFPLHYRPLIMVVGFNLFTVFIFLTAPIEWNTDNLPIVTLLILISLLAIVIGYKNGYKSSQYYNPRTQIFHRLSSRGQTLVFIVCSLTFPLKYAYLLKRSPEDIGGMVGLLMTGIRDPNLGYSIAIDPSINPTIPWTIYFFISVINQVFFIIGLLCWKRFNVWKKGVFLIFLAAEIFYWMGVGTNFGLISLITTFTFVQFYHMKAAKLNSSHTLRYAMVLLILFVASLCIFSYNLKARSNYSEIDLAQFDLGGAKVDPSNFVVSILPIPLRDAYLYLVSYLAQGYYHTCLAFDLNFKWTWFIGNSPALINLAQMFGINVWEDTFIYRLGTMGVDPLVNWHSAYSWFASDVSFYGVPFLLYIFGYVFGVSWGLSLRHDDDLSKVIFVIFGNILLYLFANNSYLSSVFYTLMFIMPIWIYTRFVIASSRNS